MVLILILSRLTVINCTFKDDGFKDKNAEGNKNITLRTVNCCSNRTDFVCNPHFVNEISCDSPPILLQRKFSNERYNILSLHRPSANPKLVLEYNKNIFHSFCHGWIKGEIKEDAALVCSTYNTHPVNGTVVTPEEYNKEFQLTAICLLCSVIFSSLTLIIYLWLPWLRDLQGKVIISLLTSITIGYFSLLVVQMYSVEMSKALCIFSGMLTYYWLLAAFFWLHTTCFNIWRSIVLSQYIKLPILKDNRKLFKLYTWFGWGAPGIGILIALITDFVIEGDEGAIRPRFGLSRCWFHEDRDLWIFFYGPVLILLVINILYFVSVVYTITKACELQQTITNANTTADGGSTVDKKKLKNKLARSGLYLRLFFAMGVTFLFEIISHVYYTQAQAPYSELLLILFEIMDVINGLQGVALFVVLVLTRPKVLKGMLIKLNLSTNQSSNIIRDQESDCDMTDSEEEGNRTNDTNKNVQTSQQRQVDEIQMQ